VSERFATYRDELGLDSLLAARASPQQPAYDQ
jgi:hypothetical protein